MDRDPQLYALVLGTTLMLLRERRKLRQAGLAELAGIPPSTLCRIESGQSQVVTFALDKLAASLKIKPSQLLALVDDALRRAERAARQILKVPTAGWWHAAQERVGLRGAGALVTFAVSAALAEIEIE